MFSAVFASFLPYRGQYLETLKAKYEQLHEMQVRALEGRPAAGSTSADSNTALQSTNDKSEVEATAV